MVEEGNHMSAAAASTTLRALAALCAGCAASISFAHAETDQERYQAAERLAVEHIALYRTADFDVFTNQKWHRIQESHANDVVVHWPDGRQTRGIQAHIDDLRAMFVYAPDSRIRQHAVEFATQEWSSIVGILEGTFTQHMPTPDGKTIPPTGKPFKVVFSAVDHWKDGLIDEEFLFWDNLTFMRQVGLAP
jgi:predicted ester cyclase